MAAITEDYVSFETAKLLKEKGFDVYGDGSFGSETKIWMEYSPFGKIRDVSSSRPSTKGYPAPTLQMAMKWLRETHKLYINIWADPKDVESNDFDIIFRAQVYNGYSKYGIYEFYTYEEAAEIVIKYWS